MRYHVVAENSPTNRVLLTAESQSLFPAAPSLVPSSHRQLLSSSPSVHLIRPPCSSVLRAKVCNAKTPQHQEQGRRRGGNASAKAGGVIRHETEFRSGVKEEQRKDALHSNLSQLQR